MNIEIPRKPSEINSDWLSSVLCTSRVIRSSIDLAESQGTTSTLVRIRVAVDPPNKKVPGRIVAKLKPTDDEVFDRFRKLGFYSREVGFYRDLDDPGLSVPVCYYAAEDHSGSFILLLEDLGAQRAFNGAEDVRSALQQIAGLHARWWGSDELDKLDWCSVENTRSMLAVRGEELQHHFLSFISGSAQQMLPRRIVDFLNAWVENYPLLCETQPLLPLTLIHGDFWPGQLFFSNDETCGLRVVDWQSAHLNTAAVDVARINCDGLARGMSTSLEKPLIKSYMDALSKKGVPYFQESDFEMDYCLGLVGVLDLWVTHTVRLGHTKVPGMQAYFDALVWLFDTHQVIERIQEHLDW